MSSWCGCDVCRNDQGLRETMIKVESAIDAGKLRMKPEVRQLLWWHLYVLVAVAFSS